jgi:hypothetical protein
MKDNLKSVKCRRAIGLPLSVIAQLWERGMLEEYIRDLVAAEKEARER